MVFRCCFSKKYGGSIQVFRFKRELRGCNVAIFRISISRIISEERDW